MGLYQHGEVCSMENITSTSSAPITPITSTPDAATTSASTSIAPTTPIVADVYTRLCSLGMSTPVVKALARYVSNLQNTLPKNDKGESLAYVDPQVVASTGLLSSEEEIQSLQNIPREAVVSISYHEGYATVAGLPFWERLDGELIELYNMFKLYRDMKYTTGTRNLQSVAEQFGMPLPYIYSVSRMYHWVDRVKAYDKFKELEREARRQQEVINMESRHTTTARELFNICVEFIKNNKAQLTPKSARDWFETAVRLERLSLGLEPGKPYDKNTPPGPSTIIQNYQIGQGASVGSINGDEDKHKVSQFQEIIDILVKAGALDVNHKEGKSEQDEEENKSAEEAIDIDSVEEVDERCEDDEKGQEGEGPAGNVIINIQDLRAHTEDEAKTETDINEEGQDSTDRGRNG